MCIKFHPTVARQKGNIFYKACAINQTRYALRGVWLQKTNRYTFGSLSEMNATANKKTAVYFTMSEYETADTLSIKPIKYYVCKAQI